MTDLERSMSTWESGSQIVATMLNPAFVASVIAKSAEGFKSAAREGLIPWPLAFVVAPLVLHRSTREALPAQASTHLATWVSRHPLLRAGFPYRAAALTEAVRAGIRFGVAHDGLLIEEGALRSTLGGTSPPDEGDASLILGKAHFVGRWLTKLDEPATAFALLGVQP